jgi:hypothetical protein
MSSGLLLLLSGIIILRHWNIGRNKLRRLYLRLIIISLFLVLLLTSLSFGVFWRGLLPWKKWFDWFLRSVILGSLIHSILFFSWGSLNERVFIGVLDRMSFIWICPSLLTNFYLIWALCWHWPQFDVSGLFLLFLRVLQLLICLRFVALIW